MAGVKVQALDNEPFIISGEIDLVDGQGNTILMIVVAITIIIHVISMY